MAKHYMILHGGPFDKIKNGSKIYELRLYDEKRKRVQVGDIIEFTKPDGADKCTVQVVDLLKFDSFDELYATLPLEQCGYNLDELDKASPKDMEEYYSKERQSQYGVVAIKMKLINGSETL